MNIKITSIDRRLEKLKLRLRRDLTAKEIRKEHKIVELLTLQANRCAICKDQFSERNVPVCDQPNLKDEHIRGMVCKFCDNAIRYVRDEILAEKLMIYFKNNGIRKAVYEQFDTGTNQPPVIRQEYEDKPIVGDWFSVKKEFE